MKRADYILAAILALSVALPFAFSTQAFCADEQKSGEVHLTFDKDAGEFPLGQALDMRTSVEGGRLILDNRASELPADIFYGDLSFSDFDVAVDAEATDGIRPRYVSVIFGVREDEAGMLNYYTYCIFVDLRQITLLRVEGSDTTDIIPARKDDRINKDGVNRLGVKMTKGVATLSINDEVFDTGAVPGYKDGKLGIETGPASLTKFGRFDLSYQGAFRYVPTGAVWDDFSNLTAGLWRDGKIGDATFARRDGRYVMDNSSGKSQVYIFLPGDRSDFRISANVRFESAPSTDASIAGFIVRGRQASANSPDLDSYYVIAVRPDASANVYIVKGGDAMQIGETVSFKGAWNKNDENNVSVLAKNDSFELTVNYSDTYTFNDTTLADGVVGLIVGAGVKASLSDFYLGPPGEFLP